MGREKRRVKRTFTLIEIVVCLAIISMMGTLVIFKASNMLSYYRFNRQISELENELDLTHNLSIAYHTDIELVLQSTDKGLLLKRSTDEPMPQASRYLKRARYFSALTSIEQGEETQESLAVVYFGGDPSKLRPNITVKSNAHSKEITM